MPIFNKPLSEYKRFMEALNWYDDSYDLMLEDAMADKLKALLGDDYYTNIYVPFKDKIAPRIKVGEKIVDGKKVPIMGENPDLKLKRPDYLLKTYSKNPQELKDLIANYKTKSDEIKEAKKGAKYLGENGEYKCYFVFTYPAAKYYGENTKWCITGRYEGREEEGEKFFNDYIEENSLDGGYYFFLHKTIPDKKYCILQKKDKKDEEHPLKIHSVWNAQDESITYRDEFYNLNLPKIKEIPDLDTDLIKISRYILQACKNEDIDKLKELLDQLSEMEGTDINKIKDDYGSTPLYWACFRDNIEIVKLLIDHGADPNIGNIYGTTPLYWACSRDNIEIVKLLLEHGADPNIQDDCGTTPLYCACSKDNIELVKLLLEHGADVNSKDNEGETPLYAACDEGNLDLVKLLLEHGADVYVKNNVGVTPLYAACDEGNLDLVKLLLEHGADVYVKNNVGVTPLFGACDKGNLDLVKLLLEHGADVNVKNNVGVTPLEIACRNNNIDLVNLLFNHGADVNGNSYLLFETCNKGNLDLVKLLIEHGADVNVKNRYNETPLVYACNHGNLKLAKLLLEHGADVNVKNKYGDTILYTACYYNNTELLKLLLEHGAGEDLDVNNLPYYITDNEKIEDLVLSYLNKNKRTESIRLRRLYRL